MISFDLYNLRHPVKSVQQTNVPFLAAVALALVLVAASCLPKPPGESGDINITVYAFSIMKESLEKAIFPGFAAKWQQQHGQVVRFQSSFAGSETVTNQILQGAPAELAILSIERKTPERQSTKVIIATRPKPEASTTRLNVGERVVVALTSFTVLPPLSLRS